jgi:pantoate--beta-alanine ligase
MEIVYTIHEIRDRVKQIKLQDRKVGFVPTMGYLHRGHLSLVEISKKLSQFQVMSVFVNKMQFNDPKDYANYPTDLKKDSAMAEEVGVDLLFIPDDAEMYRNNLVYVDIDALGQNLCGAHRAGHFRGVLTVVSKLFNIVQPDVSVFGQKDIQQAVCIQKMVNDLNFPIKIVIAPTRREEDGLAMSSRNKHLNKDERANAAYIYRGLQKAEAILKAGERSSQAVIHVIEEEIRKGNPGSIDYISVVRYDDLSLAESIDGKSVIAVAAYFGTPRLIDNMIIDFEDGRVRCIY